MNIKNILQKNTLVVLSVLFFMFGLVQFAHAEPVPCSDIIPLTGNPILDECVGSYGNNTYANNVNVVNTVPTVVTKSPTDVTSSSARFVGSVSSKVPVTVYFNYGTTTSLGMQTQTLMYGPTNGDVSTVVSGLTKGAVYYYQIVALTANGSTVGNMVNVIPNSNSNIATVAQTSNTNSNNNAPSPVAPASTPVFSFGSLFAPTKSTTSTPVANTTTPNTAVQSGLGGSNLGAAVFYGSGYSFMPNSVLEWIFTVILIMAIIVLARQFRKKPVHDMHAVAHH